MPDGSRYRRVSAGPHVSVFYYNNVTNQKRNSLHVLQSSRPSEFAIGKVESHCVFSPWCESLSPLIQSTWPSGRCHSTVALPSISRTQAVLSKIPCVDPRQLSLHVEGDEVQLSGAKP